MGANKDGRNFFLWLVFMVFIFVGMAVLEKVLEVPAVWREFLEMRWWGGADETFDRGLLVSVTTKNRCVSLFRLKGCVMFRLAIIVSDWTIGHGGVAEFGFEKIYYCQIGVSKGGAW